MLPTSQWVTRRRAADGSKERSLALPVVVRGILGFPPTSSTPAEPPGKPKNTGVGSLSLLQGTFPTQGWNRALLQCRGLFTSRATREAPSTPQAPKLGTSGCCPATCSPGLASLVLCLFQSDLKILQRPERKGKPTVLQTFRTEELESSSDL